jgi:hypothetical protein
MPATDETGSGYVPTPTVGDSKSARNATAGRTNPESNHHSGVTLTDYVTLWPTPNVPNGGRRIPPGSTIKHGMGLTAYRDGKKYQVGLEAVAGGSLNPPWVEWLMGYPEGWTDLEDSETP